MANPYKKRAKGNWCQGKEYKGDSEERMYAKKEVIEEEKINDDAYLVRHKSKRKKNLKARLEYQISWYEQKIEEYRRKGDGVPCYYTNGLREAKKEYKENRSDKKKV